MCSAALVADPLEHDGGVRESVKYLSASQSGVFCYHLVSETTRFVKKPPKLYLAMKYCSLTVCESQPATTDFKGAWIRAPIEHCPGHSRGFCVLLLLGLWTCLVP